MNKLTLMICAACFSASAMVSAPPAAAVEPVFFEDFESATDESNLESFGFTVINPDGDKYSVFKLNNNWKGKYALCDYDFTFAKNDWLVTPALHLLPDRTYRLSFTTMTKGRFPENFEVKLGTSPDLESLTTEVMPLEAIEDYNQIDYTAVHEVYVKITTEDDYYFGFHVINDEPHDGSFCIDDIKVEDAALLLSPAAVSELSAVAGEKGALNATISFNAPLLNGGNTELTSLTKAEIYVNGNLAREINEIAPGDHFSETLETVQGDNEIMVTCYNDFGKGLEEKTSVYTGVVKPAAPSNVKARLDGDKIILTWDAPTVGIDGGYIDPQKLTYMVMRSDYTYIDEYVVDTMLEDADLESFTSKAQAIVSYSVYAESAAGIGGAAMSNGIVICNEPYSLPWAESFPNGFTSQEPWGVASTTQTTWWTTTKTETVTSQDGDNGMFAFSPWGEGESARIYTGMFDFVGTVNPVIRFWFWYDPNDTNKIDVQYTTDYDAYATLHTLDFASMSDCVEGWNECIVPLKDLIGKGRVALSFQGTGAAGLSSTFLDNILVQDMLDHNLRFNLFTAPGCLRPGQPGNFSASVENIGLVKAEGFSVKLYCDDNEIASMEGSPILPEEYDLFDFKIDATYLQVPMSRYYAVIEYDKDQNTGNNTTETMDVRILVPDYPAVTTLSGTIDAGVNVALSWEAPEKTDIKEVTEEGFESYESFIIENLGDWTLYDMDESRVVGISTSTGVIDFPNAGEPQAWIVWSPDEVGIGFEATGSEAFMPNTGSKCLASFDASTPPSDDWLVSPLLSGDAQTITFFIKTSLPNYGLQTYEVLYSLSGKSISDFESLTKAPVEAFWHWQEMAFDLPEGTKYFAIRNVSDYKLALMVDDIRFVKNGAAMQQLEISGYNVYRDGIKVNKELVTETKYVDTPDDFEKHTYTVTVVYKQGESTGSNEVLIATDGIMSTESDNIAVSVEKGRIHVASATGLRVSVFMPSGHCVASIDNASQNESFDVVPGIYIVKAGTRVWKLAVR